MTDVKPDSVWGAEMDKAEHEQTFEGFVAATKYGTIACVVILVLMAVFLL